MALDLLEFQTAQCLADLCTGLKDRATTIRTMSLRVPKVPRTPNAKLATTLGMHTDG